MKKIDILKTTYCKYFLSNNFKVFLHILESAKSSAMNNFVYHGLKTLLLLFYHPQNQNQNLLISALDFLKCGQLKWKFCVSSAEVGNDDT